MRVVGVLILMMVQGLVSDRGFAASAVNLELRRLTKCYGLLVSERIRPNDPLFVKVKNGIVSGTDACVELLEKATLGPDGRFPLVNGVPDPLAGKIAGTLMAAHRRHFSIEDPMSQITFAADLTDVNQTSYHFIYPFLKAGEPFSKVVTRGASLRAIRSLGGNSKLRLWNGHKLFFSQGNYHGPNNPRNNYSTWNPVLVERGELQGLVEDSTQNIPDALVVGYEKYFGKVNMNAHFGAGFLGTQTYHLATHDNMGGSDGVFNAFRLFGRNAYQDAFCRDLPVVRSNDVISEVRENSQIPWRVSRSCMSCHAPMDEFGASIRRMAYLRLFFSTDGNVAPGVKVGFWTDQSVPLETAAFPSAPYPDLNPDPDFYKRPPEGRLFFRNYKGDLINEKVTGLQQMGEAVARQDDLYICEASRLFDFLTGVTPVLGDPANPERPLNLTAGQKWIRELVIQYGLDLKKHQNVRETFRRMVASPLFLDPNARVNK